MGFDKYYEARQIIEDIIKDDLLGPVEPDEVICGDRPADYYILGKLYPQNSSAEAESRGSSTEDCGEIDSEDSISLCNNKKPSSFGISISLKPDTKEFTIVTEATKYIPLSPEEAQEILACTKEELPDTNLFWRRQQIEPYQVTIDVEQLTDARLAWYQIDYNLEIKVLLHRVLSNGNKIITISMINTNIKEPDEKYDDSEKVYFQPKITLLEIEKDSFDSIVYRKELSADRDVRELNMLYQNVRNYASGYGCAVDWTYESGLLQVNSEFLPRHEVLQMRPSLEFKGDILSMKYLATASKKDIQDGIKNLVRMYDLWINEQEQKIANPGFMYPDVAADNLKKCRYTARRIERSIAVLDDDKVYKAFSLANKAMYMQRKQNLIINKKFKNDESIKWYG